MLGPATPPTQRAVFDTPREHRFRRSEIWGSCRQVLGVLRPGSLDGVNELALLQPVLL